MGNNEIIGNIKVVRRGYTDATALFLADIFVGGDYVTNNLVSLTVRSSGYIFFSSKGVNLLVVFSRYPNQIYSAPIPNFAFIGIFVYVVFRYLSLSPY